VKILTTLYGTDPRWERLLKALQISLRRNWPDAQLEIVRGDQPKLRKGLPYHCATNSVKLRRWRQAVYEHGGELILLDADTVVLKPLSSAFRLKFDVAVTTRGEPLPYNAGVMFVRCNADSRAFFDRWVELNAGLLTHQPCCLAALCQYGGINQAALAYILREPPLCLIRELPCRTWNCCQDAWHTVNGETRVLHVKNNLRRVALGMAPENAENMGPSEEALAAGATPADTIHPALEVWRQYDPGPAERITDELE